VAFGLRLSGAVSPGMPHKPSGQIPCQHEPAEQDKDSQIEETPKVVMQSPKAKVQPSKAAALRRALPRPINLIDDSDDDLTPPPETPPAETPAPKPRRSGRTADNVSIAMMIEQGPKTFRAALDAEYAEQWKEAIGKEVASMESHEVFTIVEKVPQGASMIGSRWVMGRKRMANGTIDKWKVRLVGHGDLQKPGNYNDITSPVIDSASIRLALSLAAKHDLEIAVLGIPTAFLSCPLHETLYMRLPEDEWPDPYGRAKPQVKLNKTMYGIKQANQEYYKEVFDFIVDDPNLQDSIAAPGLFFGGNLISKKHFRPGGMALSERTLSVTAVRDTPVADYSVPGVNTTRRVGYRPPIAVSPFLLALLVSYFKHTVWRCGQL